MSLILLALYFAPTVIVAINPHKRSKAPAVVVNAFFGWTLVGWVIALAMAVSKD